MQRFVIPRIRFRGIFHYEEHNCFIVRVETPGVKKEDICVELEGNSLKITIDKKFEQTIYLGGESTAADDRFDLKNISAKYENGLLEITLPKSTIEKPKPASRKINKQFIEFTWINPFL